MGLVRIQSFQLLLLYHSDLGTREDSVIFASGTLGTREDSHPFQLTVPWGLST